MNGTRSLLDVRVPSTAHGSGRRGTEDDDNVNDAIRRFLDELKQRPDVRGVILFGSQARGDSRPDSDADLVVLVSDGFERAVEERDGQAFEIIFISEANARGYFATNADTAAEFWQVAKVLYDRDGAAERLEQEGRKKLAEGKPAIDQSELSSSRFNAEDQLRAAGWLSQHDLAAARLLLHHKVLELTASFFDVRQRWTPTAKRRLTEIAEVDADLHGLLVHFYGDGVTFPEQLGLARQMLPLVYGEE